MKKLLFLITVFLLSGTSSSFAQEFPYPNFNIEHGGYFSVGVFSRQILHAWTFTSWNTFDKVRPNVPAGFRPYKCMYFHFGDALGHGQYIMFCSESECETWKKNLVEMKNYFHKYDSIAKVNSVSADVVKNLTEQFSFNGYYYNCGNTVYPIVKEPNSSESAEMAVKYIYHNNKSEMALNLTDHNISHRYLVFIFEKEEDFDGLINALDWSKLEQRVKADKDVQDKRDAEERERLDKATKERALFD